MDSYPWRSMPVQIVQFGYRATLQIACLDRGHTQLSVAPVVEADEVDAALRCAAALGPAFGILLGDLDDQRLAATVTTQDPTIGFTIKVDRAVRITADIAPAVPVAVHGPALDVLEGLSLRAPPEPRAQP